MSNHNDKTHDTICFLLTYGHRKTLAGADPGFGVRGDEIRQGDLRVLLLLSWSDVYGTYDAGKLR